MNFRYAIKATARGGEPRAVGRSSDHERRYTREQAYTIPRYPPNAVSPTSDWMPLPRCGNLIRKHERVSCPTQQGDDTNRTSVRPPDECAVAALRGPPYGNRPVIILRDGQGTLSTCRPDRHREKGETDSWRMEMLIAKLSNGALILGLTEENLVRLREGKPIRVTQESHGVSLPDEIPMIGIFYGNTEGDLVQYLADAGATKQ